MYKFSKVITILFVTVFVVFNTNAQSKSELEKKKKQLQKEISYTNKLLKATKKDKALSLDELLKINRKVESRKGLIKTMQLEISIISEQISTKKQTILTLQTELETLKQEYAKMIYYAFKNRNAYDKIMFVFAAQDFNQAYKRLKYIQQYSNYRQNQAKAIVDTKEAIEGKIQELEEVVQEKFALKSLEEQEKERLYLEKQQQENIVNKLQTKEQQLKNELKKKEQAAKKLQRAIQKIIEEEIRKAREAAKKSGNSSKGFPLTPEALKLSNSFASNKGKLPWPCLEGVITGKYGQHPHPVLKGIQVNNNGIDISTTKGAKARAIFDGVVSSVAIIPGEGKVVMIRHGEYLSVYSYLNSVEVQKGDKIVTKQQLGTLIGSSGKTTTNVHLEIWKGMTKLNPEYWIYRK